MKLSEEFAAVRGNLLMQHPMPNITNAYRLFAQEERHKELSHLSTQNESLTCFAEKKNFKGQQSYNRNNSTAGNSSFNAFKSKGNFPGNAGNTAKRSQYYCTHCKMQGHSIERCFKVHGYPPGFKFKDQRIVAVSQLSDSGNETGGSSSFTQAQYNQFLEMFSKHQNADSGSSGHNKQEDKGNNPHALLAGNICLLSKFNMDWIIDSGATDHICSNIDLFHTYRTIDDSDKFITIPDGRKVQITHIGDVILQNDIIT